MTHIGLNAHLLASEPGYRAAGIHNVIHQTLTHLPAVAPADWRFTALVGKANMASYAGITLRRSNWDTRSPMRRILWEQLAQPTALGAFDLYHAMAFVAPVLLRQPMVVTVYDLTFMRYPQRLSGARRRYLRAFTEHTCRRARRILAISHSTKQDLVDLLGIPAEKIDVTPLGYDQNLFKPLPAEQVAAFKQRMGLPERFWLFLGTLEPRKNLPLLLDAYAMLPREARLPLVLAGGAGWGLAEIEAKIAAHHLQDDVHLPGFVPTEQMPLWYNSADVFIYPSVFEGFGLPVLEAMACGVPVLTSNVSSLPEVAQDAGLCLPPDDADAWAQALKMAGADAQWRASARLRGLELAQAFDWQATARLTLTTYQRALNDVT